MGAWPWRLTIGTFVGWFLATWLLGTIEKHRLVENVVFGLWTGAIAAVVVGAIAFLIRRRRPAP